MSGSIKDNRIALPINTIITGHLDNDDTCYRYKIKSLCGFGGSGIVYKAVQIDSSDNEIPSVNRCIKEYYPHNGYIRDIATWRIVSNNLTGNDRYDLGALKKCAETEVKNSQSVKNLHGTIKVLPIRHLLYGLQFQIGEESFFVENNSLFVVMDDLGDAVSLFDLCKNIVSNPDIIETNDWFSPILQNKNLIDSEKKYFSLYSIFNIVNKILSALDEIHKEGIIHGDIQPHNIFFSDPNISIDDLGTVIFIDFGASRKLLESGYTSPGIAFTTSGYTAPEQRTGDCLSKATDIYQVGKLLWYLICGDICNNHKTRLYNDAYRLEDYGINHEYCKKVYTVIAKSLSSCSQDRYQCVNDLQSIIFEFEKLYRPASCELIKDNYDPSKESIFFISRADEINEINSLLNSSSSPLFIWSSLRGMGKSTLIREYALSLKGRSNVYVLKFKNNMFSTILNAPVKWNGSCPPEKDTEKYSIIFDLFKGLNENDVVIIDEFYSDDESITINDLKTKDYQDFISFCTAKIIFVTNYNLADENCSYELQGLSEKKLLTAINRNRIIADVEEKKKEKLVHLIKGHAYLFSIITNNIDDISLVDKIIDIFSNELVQENDISIEYAAHDKEILTNESLLSILNKLYKLSGLSDDYLRAIQILATINQDRIDINLFCDSMMMSVCSVRDRKKLLELPNDYSEYRKVLLTLCKRAWLKKDIYQGHTVILKPHSLIRLLIKSNYDDLTPLVLEFTRGLSLVLAKNALYRSENINELYIDLGLYLINHKTEKYADVKKEDYDSLVNAYVKGFYCLANNEDKSAIYCFNALKYLKANIDYFSNSVIGMIWSFYRTYDKSIDGYEILDYIREYASSQDTSSEDKKRIEQIQHSFEETFNIVEFDFSLPDDDISDYESSSPDDTADFDLSLPDDETDASSQSGKSDDFAVEHESRNLSLCFESDSSYYKKLSTYDIQLINTVYSLEKCIVDGKPQDAIKLMSDPLSGFQRKVKAILHFNKQNLQVYLIHYTTAIALISPTDTVIDIIDKNILTLRYNCVNYLNNKQKTCNNGYHQKEIIGEILWLKYGLILRVARIHIQRKEYVEALEYANMIKTVDDSILFNGSTDCFDFYTSFFQIFVNALDSLIHNARDNSDRITRILDISHSCLYELLNKSYFYAADRHLLESKMVSLLILIDRIEGIANTTLSNTFWETQFKFYIENGKERKNLISALEHGANHYKQRKRYSAAINCLTKELAYIEDEAPIRRWEICNSIADLSIMEGESATAKKYAKKALEYYEATVIFRFNEWGRLICKLLDLYKNPDEYYNLAIRALSIVVKSYESKNGPHYRDDIETIKKHLGVLKDSIHKYHYAITHIITNDIHNWRRFVDSLLEDFALNYIDCCNFIAAKELFDALIRKAYTTNKNEFITSKMFNEQEAMMIISSNLPGNKYESKHYAFRFYPTWLRAGIAFAKAQQYEIAIDYYLQLFGFLQETGTILRDDSMKRLYLECSEAYLALGDNERSNYFKDLLEQV